ncbi:MAG: hypothetical protein R3178_03525, partial [Rhodothermales bacterium]|nr:hypothetical protein [Rhodothermales bacterium]
MKRLYPVLLVVTAMAVAPASSQPADVTDHSDSTRAHHSTEVVRHTVTRSTDARSSISDDPIDRADYYLTTFVGEFAYRWPYKSTSIYRPSPSWRYNRVDGLVLGIRQKPLEWDAYE